ncbi:hypothetical protein [Endozoicomonas sp. ALE010]|uniref:hypothetical protein n=1 Tax=Endozoicomonas sp. ALE010 TaxID=3403081 RepID=UPI003BB803D1
MKKKRLAVYQNLSKMFYDLVKVPLGICLLQPLFAEKVPGEILFFGSTACLLFLYLAVVFDFKSQEDEYND